VRSAPCMWRREARVSWLSLKTKVYGLLVVWPQNYWDNFLYFGLKTSGDGFFRFDLKIGGDRFSLVWPQNWCRRFLPVWPQNLWLRVSRFESQNRQLRFDDLNLKIT
jgi:hypothetical protein